MLLDIIRKQVSVATEDEFGALLASERVRAERYGSKCSVLAFRASDRKTGARQQRRLQAALGRRLRATDQLGWARDGALMVLLPETDEAGARRVVDDVMARLPKAGSSKSLSIQLCAV